MKGRNTWFFVDEVEGVGRGGCRWSDVCLCGERKPRFRTQQSRLGEVTSLSLTQYTHSSMETQLIKTSLVGHKAPPNFLAQRHPFILSLKCISRRCRQPYPPSQMPTYPQDTPRPFSRPKSLSVATFPPIYDSTPCHSRRIETSCRATLDAQGMWRASAGDTRISMVLSFDSGEARKISACMHDGMSCSVWTRVRLVWAARYSWRTRMSSR